LCRFNVWPYLEQFAVDAGRELVAELGGKPNLIIGNYSDGNLARFQPCCPCIEHSSGQIIVFVDKESKTGQILM
jgi:hypothetical protein